MRNYILKPDPLMLPFNPIRPVPEEDILVVGEFMEKADLEKRHERHAGHTTLGGVDVSTVFLSINHQWGKKGPPILWETMIFSADESALTTEFAEYQERYTSYHDALRGHAQAVKLVADTLQIPAPKLWIGADPSWRTDTVIELTRQAINEFKWEVLPILADALQDAGCEDAEFLLKLRTQPYHMSICPDLFALIGAL